MSAADDEPRSMSVEIQTQTAWGRTLAGFAAWCLTPSPGVAPRALDVGCGPGLLPALLAERGCRAVGADLDGELLAHRLHPALACADALRLPFPSGAFDLLTASNVLFLLPDPPAALAEMRRVLRPGGTLALLNPSERMSVAAAAALAAERGLAGLERQSLLGWAARAESHARWDEAETRRLLESAGLTLTASTLKIGPGLARWVKATG